MQTPRSSPSIDRDGFQDFHSRWLAMAHRSPASHSSFVYGVISTKIFCRPTCSARRARRANVVFYDTKEDAMRHGFRPCKRCKPDDDRFFGDKEEIVAKAIALLRTQHGKHVMGQGLKALAEEVGVTQSYLCRVFKQTLGITIGLYMTEFERKPGDSEQKFFSSPNNIEAIVMDASRSPYAGSTNSKKLSSSN